MFVEDFGGGLPVEALAGPVVERESDGFEVLGGSSREVRAFREVLAQQAVDASMSSGVVVAGDVVLPGGLIGGHGPVDDVDEVTLEDASGAAAALGGFVAGQ